MARCNTVEFIDEYRLLASTELTLGAPLSLVVMDTRKIVRGVPTKTFFHLPRFFSRKRRLPFLLERGMHKPSLAEALAPFHQDPAQRIVALAVPCSGYHLVFQVGVLLEFLQSREGSEIGWDEWKSRVAIPPIARKPISIWVSGCRLFCVSPTGGDQGAQMEVYDFSMQGRAKYPSGRIDKTFGGVRYLASTGVKIRVPCDGLIDACSSHESTVFSHVSIGALCSLWGRG